MAHSGAENPEYERKMDAVWRGLVKRKETNRKKAEVYFLKTSEGLIRSNGSGIVLLITGTVAENPVFSLQ